VGEALLTRIEINRCDTLPRLQQRDSDMQSGRGLSRTTFLVSENDNVRRLNGFLNWLNQHAAPLRLLILKIFVYVSQVNPDLILS
jgi:hypothetical protein